MSARLAALALALAVGLFAAAPAARGPSLGEYARQCAERVGEVPEFDCAAGTLIPITVDGGKAPPRYQPNMTCDRPSLLPPGAGEKSDGQCVPNSRALVLRDDGKTQLAVFCRQKLIRPAGTPLYDEIDVVLHGVASGSTCWFQARKPNPEGDPAIGVDGRRVPAPGSPAGERFWQAPASVAAENCGFCHDSGPFYYSPFIGQTGQVPADPLGRYANDIGKPFQDWPKPLSLSTRGNTCTGCHRIGSEYTCQTGMYQSIGAARVSGLDEWGRRYPQSHWMPIQNQWTRAQWEVIYAESVRGLAACCQDPRAPGCTAVPVETAAAHPAAAGPGSGARP